MKLNNTVIQAEADRLELWARFIRDNELRNIAEFGVWKGEFAKKILTDCPGIESYIMVDSWKHLEGWNKPYNVTDDQFEDIYRQAVQNTEFAKDRIRILRGTTLEVRKQIRDNSLDFIYIDGDHTLRGIVIDAISAWPKLRAGGILAGDDLTESIWQHSEEFEPSMVNPFIRYFADAVGETLHMLPSNQYFIQKSSSGSFGESAPSSMNYNVLPLLKRGSVSVSATSPSSNGRYVYKAKSLASYALSRFSPRYREFQTQRRTSIKFPDHFLDTGIAFIHIPKAAGTSISLALYGRSGTHISIGEYWERFPYSMKKVKTVAVMRDPFERFVSAFNYLKNGGINEFDAKFANEHLSRFNSASELAERLISSIEQHQILSFMHFRPQVHWIADGKRGHVVDCLVPLNQLHMLEEWIERSTGRRISVPITNKSIGTGRKREVLSGQARTILEKVYAKDLRIWDAISKDPRSMGLDLVGSSRNQVLATLLSPKT